MTESRKQTLLLSKAFSEQYAVEIDRELSGESSERRQEAASGLASILETILMMEAVQL
jgi:hypothetical protein